MPNLRSFIGRRPALFYPLYRLLRRDRLTRALLLDRTTVLVVEGFPRCGNTFAVLALQSAQPRPLAIAHHLHHPAQVQRGVAWGVPCVVLIREPEPAVRSFALRRPVAKVGALVRQYLDFYEALEPLAGSFLTVDFAALTRDFGAVTQAINARFGTQFACFDHTAANQAAVFKQIEQVNRAHGGSEYEVSRPSGVRQQLPTAELQPGELALLARAQDLYERFRAQPGAVV